MARRAKRPRALLSGVFTVDDATRAGLERWHLEGSAWTRLGPSLYVSKDLTANPIHRLEAARHRLPPTAAFSGLTAAWLHGLDVRPCDPTEVTVPEDAGISSRSGIALRRSALANGDVVRVRGMAVTSIARTVGELCARLDLVEAVVIADEALHSGRLRLDQLTSWAHDHAGNRGMRNLRRVLGFVDAAAESPMESRLRMVLVLGGLPRPRAQVTIRDRWGRALGRPDLYYADQRLGIEYDGGTHRESLTEDNRRQNRLLKAGVRLLRFTAADVLRNPEGVVSQVQAVLSATDRNSATAGGRGFHQPRLTASASARG
jgi:very-short-patch-repair endonuclease